MERLAIIDGIRTPMGKAGGVLSDIAADDLGAFVVREVVERISMDPKLIDEVIIGNVAQPSTAANISRVIALKAGLDKHIPAVTVHRNCASGMEAITTAYAKLLSGEHQVILAGGTESMSNIPLLFGKKMTRFFDRLNRAKTLRQRLNVLASFRLSFLAPRIGVLEGLTDPTCGLIMGLTAENIAKTFAISRRDQDEFALRSHMLALAARENGIFSEEIMPIPLPPSFSDMCDTDDGPRDGQSMEALAKLRPYFDRKNGTVTVGNACPITDGAAAMLVMLESKAKHLGLEPLGYVTAFSYAGLDADRMGLGPAYAVARLFEKTDYTMTDFDLIEVNEAFAAQVLGCIKAFESSEFSKREFGRDSALGSISMDRLNVNGGAIALGHPVGMTGMRLVLTLLKELRRRDLQCGLATLCVGGGQGAALVLEVR